MNWRSLLDRAPEYTFALAALVAPPLAVLLPLGMAVELPILGAIFGVLLWRQGHSGRVSRPAMALLLLFGLWGGVTLLWAADPLHGFHTLLKVLMLSVCGMLAVNQARVFAGRSTDLVVGALGLGLTLATLVLAWDYLGDHSVSAELSRIKGLPRLPEGYKSQLSRGATILALLIWPLVCSAWRRRGVLVIAVIGLVVTVLAIGDSLAAQVAMVASALTFAAVMVRPSCIRQIAVVAVIGALVILPGMAKNFPKPPESFTTLPGLPTSAHHRLSIWQFVGERIAEHPWRGWGVDAARTIPGGDEVLDIPRIGPDGTVIAVLQGERLPLHPHSATLQIWLELGLPGALLFGGLILWLAGAIRRAVAFDDVGRAAAMAMLVAGLVISDVSYGIWQSWWLASLWLSAGLAVVIGGRPLNGLKLTVDPKANFR